MDELGGGVLIVGAWGLVFCAVCLWLYPLRRPCAVVRLRPGRWLRNRASAIDFLIAMAASNG